MRDRGTFNFSGNLEVKKDAPLEARSLVGSYADLTKPETWTDEEGGVWIYDGMNVTCKDRPGKIYQLSTGADYTQEDSWILIGDTINQAKTLSSATAGQWIRFAELSDSGYNSALVTIKEGTAGATFFFKCRSNGEVTVKVMDVTPNIYLTKIRVIKQNGQSNGYLEAYVDTASSSIAANISLSININLTDITVTSEIPGGYTSEEVSLV